MLARSRRLIVGDVANQIKQIQRLIDGIHQLVYAHALLAQLGDDGFFAVGFVPFVQEFVERGKLFGDDFFGVIGQFLGDGFALQIKPQLARHEDENVYAIDEDFFARRGRCERKRMADLGRDELNFFSAFVIQKSGRFPLRQGWRLNHRLRPPA